ncbi:YdcF family protein [Candidatus Saccharibacteria bacterium CPR2]|nr:YdcF family protein [Candidatus Saccharibacteria bacterium CPR2]
MIASFAKTAFIAIVVVGLLVLWGSYLGPKDKLKQADAIIAISGGDTLARTQKAVELYREGWASEIIFSGAALDPKSPSNAAVMREIAQGMGVPSNVIQIEEESIDTESNASQSQSIAKKRKFNSIILVTSSYHQRRAYMEFRDKFGEEVKIINSPAEDKNWNSKFWWLSPYGWFLSLSETAKIGLTLIKNR